MYGFSASVDVLIGHLPGIQDKCRTVSTFSLGTSMNGGWDLIDIMISECRKNDVKLKEVKKHTILIQNPQKISDKEINVLYNVG
jgi:hypothetical protein